MDKDDLQKTDIQPLIKDLESEDETRYQNARTSLKSIGAPAVEYLVNALTGNDAMRQAATRILGEIGDPSAIPALINIINDQDFDTRWYAAEALIDIGPDSLVPLLRKLIDHADSAWFRDGAAHVLHGLARQGYYEKLQPVLKALVGSEAYLKVPVAAEQSIGKIQKG